MNRKETGAEELRRIVRVLNDCNESTLDPWSPVDLINIVRACWASPWDVYPDQLTHEEREYAATHGKLSGSADSRLDKKFGG